MSTYQIRITKLVPNAEFEKQVEEYQQKNRGRYMDSRDLPFDYPQREVLKDVLLVELTEDQYKAMKLEVLKAFE